MTRTALRPARPDDAPALARLADMAGDGLPSWWWSRLAPCADPFATGAARAARGEGCFSWRNAVVAEAGGAVRGCVLGYPLDPPAAAGDAAHPVFAPLDALESAAGRCFYVNFLGVEDGWRGRGLGARLLSAAHAAAAAAGRRRLALIASGANAGALRFYAREGFARLAERPAVAWSDGAHAGAWILLGRPVAAAAAA